MNYVKMLAVAAAALMAFAGVASATTVTSPMGTAYTGKIAAEGLGHLTLHAANGISVSCPWSISVNSLTHGSGVTAKGAISTLTVGTAGMPCTNSDVVHVAVKGSLEIHHITGTANGTVTTTGTTVNVTDNTGVSCGFLTSETTVGELTGGTPAIIHVRGALIPRHSGSILCGATGTLTGGYKVTSPGTLLIDA